MLFFRIYDFKIGLECEDIDTPVQAMVFVSSNLVMDDKRLVRCELSRLEIVKKEKEFFQGLFLPELSWAGHLTLDKLDKVKNYIEQTEDILPPGIELFLSKPNYYVIDLLQYAPSSSAFYTPPHQIFDLHFREAYFLAFITYSLKLFAESLVFVPDKNINSCLRTEKACAAIAIRQGAIYESRKNAKLLLEHEEVLYEKTFTYAAAAKKCLARWKAKLYESIRIEFKNIANAYYLLCQQSLFSSAAKYPPSLKLIENFIIMQQEHQCYDIYALIGCILEGIVEQKQQAENSFFKFFSDKDDLLQSLEELLSKSLSNLSPTENEFYISKYKKAQLKFAETLDVVPNEDSSSLSSLTPSEDNFFNREYKKADFEYEEPSDVVLDEDSSAEDRPLKTINYKEFAP